jgi:CubicO group peptidase (beta-lactamase class C family)
MKLVEMGKIKLNDGILQFGIDDPKDGVNLVNYLDWDGWNEITIEHLMKHTSGIPDLMNEIPDFNVHYGEFGQEQDPDKLEILRAVAQYPLHFAAGEQERYSNTNFWLIGKIIEHVTKKPYGDAIKELIFDPLEMKHTYWAYESTNPPKLVKGTVLDATTNKVLPPFPIKPFDAWAIFYSTPEDMLKLGQAFVDDEILTEKTRKMFFKKDPDDSPGQLGAIHDGYLCRWDAYVSKGVVFMMVVNQFGQTVIDPLMELASNMRDAFVKI